MGITICLLNQKGGVGKTSTCHHLAGTLARAGRRVLLLDNDPQASASPRASGGPRPRAGSAGPRASPRCTTTRPTPIPEALIRPTGFDGVSIVPGSKHLTPFNMMPPETWPASERGMREFLAEVRDDFDVTLIDCPPNLHLCSRAALVASDFLVVPVQVEDYGAQGLEPVQEAVAEVQAGPNPALGLLGFLVTMYDKRLGIHLAYEALLREMYGPLVFAAAFPLAKDFKEAVASRQPISHYKPKSAAAKAARAVADELMERVARGTPDERRVA